MKKSRLLMILLMAWVSAGMLVSSYASESSEYTWNVEVGDTFDYQIRRESPSPHIPDEMVVQKGTHTISILEINPRGWNETDGVGYKSTQYLKDQDGEEGNNTNMYYTGPYSYFRTSNCLYYRPIVSNEFLESFVDDLDNEVNSTIQSIIYGIPVETQIFLEITNETYDYGYEISITDGEEIDIEYKLLYNDQGILLEYHYKKGDWLRDMETKKGIPGYSPYFIALFSIGSISGLTFWFTGKKK